MGIFSNNENTTENAILQAFSSLPILEDLVHTVVNNEEEWLSKCQGYYDSRVRKVTIAADLFKIEWIDYHYEGKVKITDVIKEVSYNYTSSGYAPLHPHLNAKGKEDVNLNRVIYLWSSTVYEKLRTSMPNCEFRDVTSYGDHVTFTYSVPALYWKRWF